MLATALCVCMNSHVPTIQGICLCVSHPAIFAFIKYLWGQRVPRRRPGPLRNILSHPLPVGLIGRDVTLLELDLIGCQEAHHILLLLFDLRAVETGKGKLSVRCVNFSRMRKHMMAAHHATIGLL